MEFEQLLQVLALAVVVLVYWWSYRSFPPGETAPVDRRGWPRSASGRKADWTTCWWILLVCSTKCA